MNAVICIHAQKLSCLIGCHPHERHIKQVLLLNLKMRVLNLGAFYSDALEDTVDYDRLAAQIDDFARNSQYHLIETLAFELMRVIFAFDSRIDEVEIELEKPGCISSARSASIQVISNRSSFNQQCLQPISAPSSNHF